MPEDQLPDNSSLVHSLDLQPLDESPQKPMKTSNSHPSSFLGRFLLGLLLIIIVLAVGGYLFVFIPGQKLYASVKKIEATGRQAAAFAKSQDLQGTKQQLDQMKLDLDATSSDFKRFSWLKIVPFAANYYSDGEHGIKAAYAILEAGNISINAIAPYADIIGLKGLSGTGDGAKTAQDRINFIINTLDKIKPQLSDIGARLEVARKEVDQIDPARYPEEIKGKKIREQLTTGITLLDEAATLVTDARPLLESAPFMLGLDSPRKYLVLFQNDAELRPTGGFITAYAILQIDKGKMSMVQSDDIYHLDDKFTKNIPAPEPIKKYLPKVSNWNLRDMNLSPDFKVSMEQFFPNYKLTKSPEVDGIIALDTQVLVDLLKVTGPIGVPGFGNYNAENDKRCNCPQVFYELELYADIEGPVVWDSVSGNIIVKPKNYGERKAFIGPLTHSVLSNVMAQPKSKMASLFSTAMNLIQSKHIEFYFPDQKVQTAVETFNMAGRVRETAQNQDYLLVVDTNFAGAKTNAWVNYTADMKVDISGDGTVTKTLTLTYKNPQQNFQDTSGLKLNGIFRDWLRVYVPKGSKLLEAKGFETGQASGEDLGKTVFEGFFTLTPLNVKTITLKYELPNKVKSPYELMVQKQPGSKSFPYKVTLNGRSQPEFLLDGDKEFSLSF